MGNLDKLLVLLMLLLGMDLYIDLDLEQHSIGPRLRSLSGRYARRSGSG